MATTNAPAAICKAIAQLLEGAFAEDKAEDAALSGLQADFEVYNAKDVADAQVRSRVTVLLYRVVPNLAHRTPAGRALPDGRRQRSRLPVDLELLVTIWGTDATTQNQLAGWALRTLEDYPTLPASLVNRAIPGTFDPGEEAQLVISELPLDHMLDLWERVSAGKPPLQISVPYVVRAVMLDSRRALPAGEPVQTRGLAMYDLVDEP